MKRILVVVAVIVTILVGVLSFVPTQAHAAASRPMYGCSGHGCDGQYASQTGCTYFAKDVTNVDVYDGALYLGTAQLFYSSGCGTNWTHIVNPRGYRSVGFVTLCSGTGLQELTNSSATSYDTPMVYAPTTPARATGEFIDVNGPHYGVTACF